MRAVFPSDPRHLVERAAHPIFDDLVEALRETATALRAGNLQMAEHALHKARETDGRMDSFREALDAGYAGGRSGNSGSTLRRPTSWTSRCET